MTHDRWYNPMMRWLLRSRFHWLVSHSVLLISYSGRKSGNVYSVPINFRRHGNFIQLISNKDNLWWHNFDGGAPVTLRLRGVDVPASARVIQLHGADMICALSDVYSGMSLERAAKLADESVLIAVRLAEAPAIHATRPTAARPA